MDREVIKQRLAEYIKIRDEYLENMRKVKDRIDMLKSNYGEQERIRSLQGSYMDMTIHYGQVCQYIDRFREILDQPSDIEVEE